VRKGCRPIKTGRPTKRLAMSPREPIVGVYAPREANTQSGIGPMLLATNSRPGPASIHSARRTRMPFAQTVGRDTLGRARSPNRVAWRFPDWTAVGFRYREQALRRN
jgi:hypothetical protein